jgi:hypothetical protein
MESTPTKKLLPQIRFRKFTKKVTWSENLTDIKVMTPQPSGFDTFAGIVFLEEEEENFCQDNKE